MTVTVRPAGRTDIPAITRIYGHAVEHGTASFELTAPDQAEMTRRFDELTTNGFPYLVAVVDGAVVGYAYAGPYRTRPAYRFTVENSVYVAHDSLRRGVGKALLQALIDACTEKGFRLMVAVIGDSDQAASIGLQRLQASNMPAYSKISATSSNAGSTALSCSAPWARERANRLDRSVRHECQTID